MLVQVGDVWVIPSEVVSVARLHGAPTMLMRSGPMVSPSTGQTVDEIAAALAPAATGPVRAIHPLALAYLEAAHAFYRHAGRLADRTIAEREWEVAGCPIWAEL